jgi:alanine racemase
MSHLACSEEPAHPKNAEQRARFAEIRARYPGIKGSLANSGGIFLGSPYTHDLVRPGAAIYGLTPTTGVANPMKCVVKLEAPLLQVRQISKDDTVGYGATFRAGGPMRIATLGVGYADGYPRSLSGRGSVILGGQAAPILGRVSMDLVTIDVTALPENTARVGALAELIGPSMPPDDVARAAGTIGYEILTGLGPRYARDYKGQPKGGEV